MQFTFWRRKESIASLLVAFCNFKRLNWVHSYTPVHTQHNCWSGSEKASTFMVRYDDTSEIPLNLPGKRTLWQRKKIRENIILNFPFINVWKFLQTILLSWHYVNKIIFLISSHSYSWCILTGELYVVASLIHATSTWEIENVVIVG